MAGLGFVNPEKRRAQMLALLNGSTSPVATSARPAYTEPSTTAAPPVPPAPPPSQVQPLPMPPMVPQMPGGAPGPSTVAPLPYPNMDVTNPNGQPQTPPVGPDGKPDPKWYEVAGALGHVLLSADAGYNGQPMPENPLDKQREAAMREQEFIFNTIARAWETIRNADPANRPALIKQFADIIAKVAPDFDFNTFVAGLQSDEDKVDALAPQIAMMSPEAKRMFMARVANMGGDPSQAAATLLNDPEFMQTLFDFDDEQNIPVLKYKMQRIKGGMASMGMDPNTFNGMSPDEFARINASLPESMRLTPSELATLRRHPELGRDLGMGGDDQQSTPTVDSRSGYQPGSDRTRTQAPPPPPRTPSGVLPDDPGNEPAGGENPPRRAPPASPRKPSGPARTQSPRPQGPPAHPNGPIPEAPPRTPPRTPPVQRTPQRPPQQPRQQAPATPPRQPAAPPPRTQPQQPKPGARPYYPPGWKPRTPKPRGSQQAAPQQPQQPAPRVPPKTTQPPATPPRRPQNPQPSGERRYVLPKDTTIPGIGPMRKGEVVYYDYNTGQYRRGK